MSYSIQVTFAADGTATVTSAVGDLPVSGHVTVDGHADPAYTNIGASLFDDAGNGLVGGFGTAPTAAPAPPVDDAAPAGHEDQAAELAADEADPVDPSPAQAVAADATAGGE